MPGPTKISDVIVPEVFFPYVIERTAALSEIFNSGIAARIPGLEVPNGGVTVNMPFWHDLDASGDLEILSDNPTHALTPEKINAGQDVAVVLARGKSWSGNDLAAAFSGDDPMRAIGELVAGYIARQNQKIILAMLAGVFASSNMSGNALDISESDDVEAYISNNKLIDAISKLGDSGKKLTGILCHSHTMYDLAKKKLLESHAADPSTGAPEFQTYLGRRLVVDDGCPVSDGVYTTYLFGDSAIGYAPGNPPVPVETDRDSLAGNDILIYREHIILHPRGVKWQGSSAGATPSNTELSAGASWSRVWENKNVRIVEFKHKIGVPPTSGGDEGGGD
jgi:hypothetical protein